jgi:beta-glucosidase
MSTPSRSSSHWTCRPSITATSCVAVESASSAGSSSPRSCAAATYAASWARTRRYPFGHGLSYSEFRYSRLRIDDGTRDAPQGDITVSFGLRNASNRAGAEAAQVYVGRLPSRSVATPPRQLAGFQKVQLQPRERRRVTVTIPRRSLSYWDTGSQHWVTPAGRVPVYVGGSSEDAALAGVITVR